MSANNFADPHQKIKCSKRFIFFEMNVTKDLEQWFGTIFMDDFLATRIRDLIYLFIFS